MPMRRIVISGLLVFVLALVVTFPARVAYRWFAPADVTLSGLSGSIWSGTAAEGLAGGAYLRDIRWRIKPASLLGAKLAYETAARPVSGSMSGDVAIGLTGKLSVTNLNGSVPLDRVHDAFQQAGISGNLSFQFSELVLQNGLPVLAIGSVTIANLAARDLSAGVLGDYRAEFQAIDGNIAGTVKELSGVLDIDGTLKINPDRSYSLIGNVAARPGTPPLIGQQLRFLGSADDQGMRQFRFEGRF